MLTKRQREKQDWDRPRIWRAAIYLSEPSTSKDDRASRTPSIDRQRLLCRCAATVLHAEVVDEFVDMQYVALTRPGLHQMLERVGQNPGLDYLIVPSMDRLVGDGDEAFETAWRLGFAGTVVIPADAEHEFPWTGSTPSRT
jgi:Resolvase, N terminal domain